MENSYCGVHPRIDRCRSRIVALSLCFLVQQSACKYSAGLPDMSNAGHMEERVVSLSGGCTLETCIPAIAVGYSGGPDPHITYETPDARFNIRYSCGIQLEGHGPVLASLPALAQVEMDCREYANNAFLVFPHWWETDCFYELEGSNPGALNISESIGDPAEYLYVACQPYDWAYEKRM